MAIKVLIIEDDEDDFIILKHYLGKIRSAQYNVYWCNSFVDAENDVLKNEHHIYLIDNYLGGGEGVQLIESLRKKNFSKPLILLTGASDYVIDSKAMEKGASDFIIKTEIKVDTLERAMRYAIERYNQQRFIREQERKYRSLFELSMEPLLILDDQFRILEYNHAFSEMFSMLVQEDTAPLYFQELFEYQFDFDSIKEKVHRLGYIRGFKTILHDELEKSTVILSLAKLPLIFNESMERYQVAIYDVSKLMEAENELQKLEKLSMTGRMARMIAHEVRNPLTNINLAVGELSELTGDLPESLIYQEMISRNAKRINSLIDELLISAKPQQLEYAKTNMQQILDSAIDFCKDRISLENVNFRKVFPDELIEGKWDPEKLKIAFVNIIINAIEAMHETTHPHLSLILTKEGESPVIYIKDNGKGMDDETVQRIFDPFFSNRKEGLGLGMTSTLNIINMHQGKISVKSEMNKGTEFKIIL